MFNPKKPTVQLLGRWQPWHDGHTALFKDAVKRTGQVAIMCRDVFDSDVVSHRFDNQNDNPFSFNELCRLIEKKLLDNGFRRGVEYEIYLVPNISDITYGRDVGYTFTNPDLGDDIHSISATKIRERLRENAIID